MMKKTLIAAALATVPLPSVAEISGNVALTTDYRFRGISQTTSDPAVQGGFDWSHDSGFYLGTWGSNVEFAGSLELDYYGGFANNINDNIAYDVGFIYYDYPGGDLGGINTFNGGHILHVHVLRQLLNSKAPARCLQPPH